MYYVVITPRTGPQFRLSDAYPDRDSAIAAAEAAITPAIVGVEVWRELDGIMLLVWERNLWEERARTAAELERDTLIDLRDAMDAGLPVAAWDGAPW